MKEIIMDKEALKNFIAFLESASTDEILARQIKFNEFLAMQTTATTRRDAHLGLRLISEELLSRECLKQLPKTTKR